MYSKKDINRPDLLTCTKDCKFLLLFLIVFSVCPSDDLFLLLFMVIHRDIKAARQAASLITVLKSNFMSRKSLVILSLWTPRHKSKNYILLYDQLSTIDLPF
jgi:hypothetical protein